MDLYSRRVMGWSIDRRMNKALVIPGFDDGDQPEKVAAGPGASFRTGQPVCQPCPPEAAETTWHDSEYQSQRRLLGQCSGRTVLRQSEAGMDW